MNTRSSGIRTADYSVARKRRTSSAYMIWMNAEGRLLGLDALGSRHKVTEIAKWCGGRWRDMSEEDKAEWEDMAQQRREAEQVRYEAECRKLDLEGRNRPKRPPSAYMLWMNEEGRSLAKEKYPGLKPTAIVSICGRMWREMETEHKDLWLRKANKLKEDWRSMCNQL